jgi:hypothetical protein
VTDRFGLPVMLPTAVAAKFISDSFSFLTAAVNAMKLLSDFSIGLPCSRAVLNSEKQSDKNACPSVTRFSGSILNSFDTLRAKRFMRIEARSAFVIFSLIFMYN